MRQLIVLLVVFVMLPGCLDSTRTPTLKETINPENVDQERINAAEAEMVAIEKELQQYAGLGPAERYAAEAKMEPRLERAVKKAAGTRIENKAIYFLANWRYTYQNGDGVEPLLNQMFALPSPALKSNAERMLVMLRLRQGRVPEARNMAEQLVNRIPEFSPLLDFVVFHETVGSAAPHIISNNLTGGPDEPVAKRSEPWLFYLFIDALDENALYLIDRYLDALSILPANERRLVCVTFEANLLSATARVRSLSRASDIDLLWANPNKGGNVEQWRKEWKLPPQNPHIALLGPGPNRTIMSVEVTPETLKELLSATVPKK